MGFETKQIKDFMETYHQIVSLSDHTDCISLGYEPDYLENLREHGNRIPPELTDELFRRKMSQLEQAIKMNLRDKLYGK